MSGGGSPAPGSPRARSPAAAAPFRPLPEREVRPEAAARPATSPAGRGRGEAVPPGAERAPCAEAGPGETVRAAILAEARSWLGTPYLHQASAKGQGADCLGLVRGVWRALYGAEPEAAPAYGPDFAERRAAEEPLLAAARRHFGERPAAAARPGDLLLFRVVALGPARHCGILSGKDAFIHAYQGRAVVESWLNRWWRERLAGVFSFPGTED